MASDAETIVVQTPRSALAEGIQALRAAGIPSAERTSEMLLMHAIGQDRTWIYTHANDNLTASQLASYASLLEARAAGRPVQYLTGRQEFWGLDFEVSPAVLIPRPETEHIVEIALERLGTGRGKALRVADVGTGSGCVAIALARELANARVVATDISFAALEVARRNALRHDVAQRIEFSQTDLLQSHLRDPAKPGFRFDLIVSNPPYVALDDAATLPPEVRDYEPHVALFGGPTGMDVYPRLIEQAAAALSTGGILVLELGAGLSESVRAILETRPGWTDIRVTPDLAGIPRIIAANRT